ncbi:MAG: hypothetical protein ACI4EA_06530, partial [Candidatus Ornithomonoglobus sp.]
WDKKYLSASYWKGLYKLVPLIWIAACAAYTYLSASEAALSLPDIALQLCYMICQLLGLASVFILYDALPSAAQNCRLFTKISSASFMIFCIHEPIQHMAYEYALDINSSNLMHMLLYFALPIFFIIISVGLNELLIRKAPGLKRFLTGNR